MPSIIRTDDTGLQNVIQSAAKYLNKTPEQLLASADQDSGNLGLSGGTAPWLRQDSVYQRKGYVPMDPEGGMGQYKDFLAQGQSQMEKRLLTVPRIANTAIHELAKTLPLLGGAIGYASTGDAGWLNNDIVQSIDKSKNYFNDELMPIFSDSKYDNSRWYEKLPTADFWATQGADGIGFLVSMYGPGFIAKSLGLAAGAAKFGAGIGKALEVTEASNELLGIGKSLSKLAPAAKTIEEIAPFAAQLGVDAEKGLEAISAFNKSKSFISKVSPLIAKTKPFWQLENGMSKFGEFVETGAVIGLNTTVEAAAEGSETYSSVYKDLLGKGVEDGQAKKLASDAASTVFNYNVPLLLLSNTLLEGVILNRFDNFLGIGKRTAKEGFEDAATALRGLGKDGKPLEALARLKPIGYKDIFKEMIVKTPIGIAKEGFMEEGLQNSIQKYATKLAAIGKSNPSFAEGFKGIFEQYGKSFKEGDDEFWESVALGGILGGFGEAGVLNAAQVAMSGGTQNIDYNRAIFGGEEYKPSKISQRLFGNREKEKQFGAINTLQALMQNGYDITQPKKFFKTKVDAQGNESIELDQEGKPIIKDDIANTFLTNSLMKTFHLQEIEAIKKATEATLQSSGGRSNELDKLISDESNDHIDFTARLDSAKKVLEESIMYEHFKPLYDMGLFGDDVKNILFNSLKERKTNELKELSPLKI